MEPDSTLVVLIVMMLAIIGVATLMQDMIKYIDLFSWKMMWMYIIRTCHPEVPQQSQFAV